MITIFKDTKKRANPYAPYTDANGTRYPRIPRELLDEIADPVPPADYSDSLYYRTEQDTAPYVVYTRKSDEQIAAYRWEALKVFRDDLILNGGCFVAGKWFHTDVYSKQQHMALMMLGASLPAGIQWKTMDGSFITLTQEIVAQLFQAQITREQGIFALAEVKRLDATPISEGWPERYIPPEVVGAV